MIKRLFYSSRFPHMCKSRFALTGRSSLPHNMAWRCCDTEPSPFPFTSTPGIYCLNLVRFPLGAPSLAQGLGHHPSRELRFFSKRSEDKMRERRSTAGDTSVTHDKQATKSAACDFGRQNASFQPKHFMDTARAPKQWAHKAEYKDLTRTHEYSCTVVRTPTLFQSPQS